ncbi:hypothetical protein PR048_025117 [Dryococelus australis]|uniref:Uncharacterized protein n=1 Tax=Dryococelus australis TaxID=614101 RepID=A0ABQ9GQK1_9NEOP|nr:hypothetical protein PR048_025117 [Dryococelus australis]
MTSSIAIPRANQVSYKINALKPQSAVGLALKAALSAEINKKLPACKQITLLSVAIILDPHLKPCASNPQSLQPSHLKIEILVNVELQIILACLHTIAAWYTLH